MRKSSTTKTAPPAPEEYEQSLRDFSKSLPMALLRSREKVMDRFRPILRAHGLTDQQFRILRALTTSPELRAIDVSRETLLSPPSLSRTIKGLEKRGLISKRVEEHDQRAFLLSISDEGIRLVKEIGNQTEGQYADIENRLGPEKMRTLYEILFEIERKI